MPVSARPIRLALIVGTRPEAIKAAPLALAAAADPRFDCRIVHTGQHGAMFDRALADFGLAAHHRLDVAAHDASVDAMTAAIRAATAAWLIEERPAMALVQGDTNSAYAAALAAGDAGIPLGHVEAGLRSGDANLPWPEERNRTAIDALADLLFAPTPRAIANLQREGVAGAALVTGNTAIDALLHIKARLATDRNRSMLSQILAADRRHLILVTCHRREAAGAPLAAICSALRRIADRGDVRLLLPVHPNPAFGDTLRARLADHPAITLTDPLDYPTMVDAMRRARLILSDSGGIQEEAPALGVPVLVLRTVTERPEALATGNLMLVGHDPDRIATETARLVDDAAAHAAMSTPAYPYGDGTAAPRILEAIARAFAS